MLSLILLALAIALLLLLIHAARRPDTFRIERSTRIQAAPERVFALINDLHGFNSWNPFEKKDPAIKGEYGAITSGPGAVYAWESQKVGVGRMTIVDTVPESRVIMKLDFFKPFVANNMAEFNLRADRDGTQVSWAMHGPTPFISKLMQVFFSMDKMVGKDFDDGLANLKTLLERH
ncbi:SRPBCC family protein [Chitinimonas arctica]|uniref:SRPBCC family protein n=1 Tax=Chitinimonas arctica TaxID=2594795 RepID=A0A516SGQ2_9NEIS|nr:SRPBCC family protein [Chitinimonas arctica]QDQ27349.1 SRPBCC family protein [Chitinimonas arctica]